MTYMAQGPGDSTRREVGWHFLQLPGPTNIPARIRNAMNWPAIDQRSQKFARLALTLFGGMKKVFKTSSAEVFIFPSSGTGAGEAALVNTLSPGDKILMFDSGWFSFLWIKMARQFGLDVEVMENDWRRGPDPGAIEARLAEDKSHEIRAVFVVHNETSNGVTARLPEIRRALDHTGHPALFIVDTISSLACMDFRFDEWGVDVAIGGSQKGSCLSWILILRRGFDKASVRFVRRYGRIGGSWSGVDSAGCSARRSWRGSARHGWGRSCGRSR